MTVERTHDELIGRTLGEFVLRERIGQGGFGAVYRAIQPALDREAVIKVLHARLKQSQPVNERFLREARLASKLDHPYAAHIYAFGAEPDGQLWIAMELVRGTPLDHVLELQGSLPLERLVPLLDRLCEVVHTAHEQGIVHRDLKPANVMVLSRAGRLLPKLLDLGIAKALVDGAEDKISGDEPTLSGDADTIASGRISGLTQRGALMGSPPYMAPEQWVDAGQADARSDLYALGILAYECLTGKPPYRGNNLSEIARAHANQSPPPLGRKLPTALDAVFAKVLAKSPDDRYPDALAFAAAFRHASGIAAEDVGLPALDRARRDLAASSAPQPIAEAIVAIDAARNAHQARDAIVQAVRTIIRYLGLLVLASRSRVSSNEPREATERLRELSRRALSEREWLELARSLTASWLDRRDAHPVPELVGILHDGKVVEDLELLAGLRDRELESQDALHELLVDAIARVARISDAIRFLADYPLVVTAVGQLAERWMGVRPPRRPTTAVRGKGLEPGVPALLDHDGAPVLSLAPLFAVAPATPGGPLELFLFDGRDARGARYIALPSGFVQHDNEFWQWFRAQLSISIDDSDTEDAGEKPPYRGLSAFGADDGASFFGREKQVDAFLNRLELQPLLAVVGPSGAGKSSFVHAGVLPALPAGWRAISLRPGASPLAALIARLEHATIGGGGDLRDAIWNDRDALGALLRAHAPRDAAIVLVVDQLEEMFTLCHDPDERRVFAEALASAARTADDPVRVIFTLRDDFLVRTDQQPALRNRIGQGLQLLTVPAADDLLRIVIEPARRAGYELEGDLAAEMVKQVADQPGALALISFTAAKLWELRDRHFRQLTRAAYRSLGGVGGALAKHADVMLDEMLPEERALAREAFRHLVTTQNTRAVLPRQDLRKLLGDSASADGVIEKLIASRLLVASESESGVETIEIVHEALLVSWPRLAEWRREDAEGARFREQLRAAAAQWHERGRAKGLLWRGDALAEYTRWHARHPGPLTDVEAAFAAASETDAARGRRNRRALLAGAFATLATVVVGLIVFNTRIAGQRRALHDQLESEYENEGRRLVLADDPLQALAYLDKARQLGADGPAQQLLVAEAVRATDGELFEAQYDQHVRSPRFSADGNQLIVAGFDGSARIFDAHRGSLLYTLPHDHEIFRVAFSPNGTTIATAGYTGVVTLWDVHTRSILRTLRHEDSAWCLSFTPSGLILSGDDHGLVISDPHTGSESLRVTSADAPLVSCALSRDGSLVAAGDRAGTARVWAVADGRLLRELHGHNNRINSLAFDRGAARLVTASADGTAIAWDVTTGARQVVLAHHDSIETAELSEDGTRIITASDDHTAAIWDATTGQQLHVLAAHTAELTRAAFTPDGKYAVTASFDGTAALWDADTGTPLARWWRHTAGVFAFDIAPQGDRVVTAGFDDLLVAWAVRPQDATIALRGHTSWLESARFSPDGRRVLTASADGTARLWDASDGRQLSVLTATGPLDDAQFNRDGSMISGRTKSELFVWKQDGTLMFQLDLATARGSAWSPDGRRLVAWTLDGRFVMWDASTGNKVLEHQLALGKTVLFVAFEPGGTKLLVAGEDRVVRTFDLSGHELAQREEQNPPVTAEFDASGTRVLSPMAQSIATIWDPTTGRTLVQLVGHAGNVRTAMWSPDGRFAITTGYDQTARIWDANSGNTLAIYETPGHGHRFASFSPDGARIVLADHDGVATIHTLPRFDEARWNWLMRCRVPYVVAGERVELRPREHALEDCHQP
jgi:WD40 repeat protein